jgi:hypothetical protein
MRYNLIIVALMVMVLSALTGCGGPPKAAKPYRPDQGLVVAPVTKAQTSSAEVKAYLGAAEGLVQQLLAYARQAGDKALESLLTAVSNNHASAQGSQNKVDAQLEQVTKDKVTSDTQAISAVRERDEINQTWERRHAALEGKWYVRWGRWIEAVVFWLVVGWAVAGLASVFLGFQPLGMLQKLSGFIVHLIPLGNVWVWVEDLVKWVRGAPARKPEP